MKIVVNTRLLLKDKLEGIGWFSFETLKRITQQHPEHHFFFLFDRPFHKEFIFSNNITPIVANLPTRHPFLWYLWFEKLIPKILKKINPDIFLSPDGYLSLKTNIPSISVIHDINFVHRPDDLPFWVKKYYNYYFPLFAKKAKKIATVSEYSKQDIVNTYGIHHEKIDVVYNGSNEIYQSISNEEKIKTKEKFSQSKDYFIFIGALHPRKNIAGLLKSFDLFKKKHQSDIQLLIVGEKMFKNKEIEIVFSKLIYQKDIIFTGRLSPEDLKFVLGSSLALVFVPFFEGFGIPIIEAMNAEVPVICSNLTSLPEVAGNATIFVNPFSTEEISNAILSVAKNESLRKKLIEKGKIQRQKFTWQKTADKLWKTINE